MNFVQINVSPSMNKTLKLSKPISNFFRKDSEIISHPLDIVDNSKNKSVASPFDPVSLDASKMVSFGKVSKGETLSDSSLIAQIKLLTSDSSHHGPQSLDKEPNLGFNELPEIVVPDLELVQQVNELLENHAPLGGMEVTNRVIFSIDSDLGQIKSLPIVTTPNPFDILGSKYEGLTDNLISPSHNGKDLPIVQSSLVLSPPFGSPRRGRPLNVSRTKLEVAARIQKTLSLSPGIDKRKILLSLGNRKKDKLQLLSPPVTRSGVVKKNLKKCFGDFTKSLDIEKRGVSTSSQEQ